MAEGHVSKQARQAFQVSEQGEDKAIPGAGDGSHAKSHAAHLQTEGDAHTHNDYGKQGREAGTLKQPPQDPRTQGESSRNQ